MKILKMASHLVLVALALVLSSSLGKAQEASYTGTFTLPFEVRWGSATLPAGDYTLRVDDAYAPQFIVIAGEDKSVIVLAGVPDQHDISNHSQLVLAETAHGYTVQSLEAAQIGLSLDYAVSKRQTTQAASIRNMPGTIEVAVLGGR